MNILKGKLKFQAIKKPLIVFLMTIYTLVCLSVFFFYEKLIFWPQQLSDEATTVSTRINSVENIELKMKDGTKIRGWLVKNSTSDKSNLLIYFGARAEEVSDLIPRMAKLQGWSVVLINYRGFGTSEGTPGEQKIYDDSLEIHDHFAAKSDIKQNNIVVMGRWYFFIISSHYDLLEPANRFLSKLLPAGPAAV